jgi:hypothetical protein
MTESNTRSNAALRTWLGIVAPLTWLAIAVLPFVLAWSRLPEPMACHFDLRGAPNGALPRITNLALDGGAALLAAIGVFVATRHTVNRASVGFAAFIGCMFAGIAVVEVAVNLDAATWRHAHSAPLPITIGLVAAAGLATRFASRAARALEPARTATSGPLATVGLGPSERAMWTGSAHNRWLVGVAFASIVVGVLLPAIGLGVCVLVAVLCLTFASVQARVDERGVRVALGPLAFPRVRFPLATIREARAVDIAPAQNGGWGYRGSVAMLGKAAIVIRGGEGLELQLDGGQVRITIDDAATAAGLVNDLIRRAHQAP